MLRISPRLRWHSWRYGRIKRFCSRPIDDVSSWPVEIMHELNIPPIFIAALCHIIWVVIIRIIEIGSSRIHKTALTIIIWVISHKSIGQKVIAISNIDYRCAITIKIHSQSASRLVNLNADSQRTLESRSCAQCHQHQQE